MNSEVRWLKFSPIFQRKEGKKGNKKNEKHQKLNGKQSKKRRNTKKKWKRTTGKKHDEWWRRSLFEIRRNFKVRVRSLQFKVRNWKFEEGTLWFGFVQGSLAIDGLSFLLICVEHVMWNSQRTDQNRGHCEERPGATHSRRDHSERSFFLDTH